MLRFLMNVCIFFLVLGICVAWKIFVFLVVVFRKSHIQIWLFLVFLLNMFTYKIQSKMMLGYFLTANIYGFRNAIKICLLIYLTCFWFPKFIIYVCNFALVFVHDHCIYVSVELKAFSFAYFGFACHHISKWQKPINHDRI